MKIINKYYFVFLLFLLIVFNNHSELNSQVPKLLSYQGQLLNLNNEPYEGFINIEFKIFDVKYGGSEIWSEIQNINVDGGYFSVMLGRVRPFGKELLFDKQYYLEVIINKGQMKYERTPLLSSPYSFRSDYSDSSNVSKKSLSLQDGSVTLKSLSEEVKQLSGDLIGTLPYPQINSSIIVQRITDGSIPNSKLAKNSVILYGTNAEGDLVGSYPGPLIANGVINNAKISSNAITSDKIKDFTILRNDLSSEVLSGDVTFSNIIVTNSLKSPNNLLTNIVSNSTTFTNSLISTLNVSNLSSGLSSSSISVNSPFANFSSSLTSPLAIFSNINANSVNSGTSSATVSINSPLGNISNINSVNVNASNGKFENVNNGTSSSSISINSPLGNITNLKSSSSTLTNLNVQNINVGTSSASISYSSPLGNFTNLNSTNFTSTFINANSVNTPLAKITDLTTGRYTSTLSMYSPQISSTQANFNNVTLGTLSTTLPNVVSINSSGSVSIGQGLSISSGGLNVIGNTKLIGNTVITGITTHNDNVLNLKEVITNGIVTNNSNVINNANFSVLGNSQIGDAVSDKFIINAETIFNQNIRFPAGLNGIFGKFNDLTVGTSSATTSFKTPLARIDNGSLINASMTNLATSYASVTISLRTPHVFADTTDINSIIARTASVTVSVRTPQLWNTHGDISILDAGTISSTVSNQIGIRASGTISSVQGLTVIGGGTNLTGRLEQHGQTTIYGNGSGNKSDYNSYALRIQDTEQGIAIKTNGSRSEYNNYIDFQDANGSQGRVMGQTKNEMHNHWEYSVELAKLIVEQAQSVYEAFDSGKEAAAAAADVRPCAGVGAVTCPPGPVVATSKFATWVSRIAAVVVAGYSLYEFIDSKDLHCGIVFESGAGDYAEYLIKSDINENISYADIVGVTGGKVSKNTINASKYMVASLSPIVLGNSPSNKDNISNYVKIAFMGQVPVKVKGKVNIGDYILPSGNNSGIGIAKNPNDMEIDDYIKIVGIAWSNGDNENFNFINVAIGINQNDIGLQISKQTNIINQLRSDLNTQKNRNNKNLSVLSKLVPGFNPELENIDNNNIVDHKLNTSFTNFRKSKEKNSETLNNSSVEEKNKNLTDVFIPTLYANPQIIEDAVQLSLDQFISSGGIPEKHPFYGKLLNQPNYKKEVVTTMLSQMMSHYNNLVKSYNNSNNNIK